MPLPINVEDLLSARTVESDRIEFKAGWNPDAIYRSICAFANDFDNAGGGYILIGVEEENGTAKRPVKGLKSGELAEMQKKMIGFNNLIRPVYHCKLFIEEADGNQIVVLWVPGGTSRPYEVPEQITAKEKRYFYYIRQYANSVKANTEQTQELISLANQVPFDDRPNQQAALEDISPVQVQDYLRISGSRLTEWIGQRPMREILEQINLLDGPPEHLLLRNVALMLFSEYPDKFFPYTYIDLVHFPQGPADKQFIEKQFKGPVQQQITQALSYIQGNFLHQLITKVEGKAEAIRVWNYPYKALEELLANCIYHRNYQEREPVTIRIEPEAIYIYNLGGPDRSIRMEDFQKGQVFPKRYRNRRLGDFLKELELTEGRATGIPVILEALRHNGSPEAVFETDADRTWFQVTLPIHPSFKGKAFIPVEGQTEVVYFKQIALINELAGLVSNLVSNLVSDEEIYKGFARILLFIKEDNQKREDILRHIGLTNQTFNYRNYIEPLEKVGLIAKTIADKPQSPKQKYYLTEKGKSLLLAVPNEETS
jgi:ATP-dependent DNA helicase RecG